MDAKDSLTQVWAHMRRRGPSQIQFWFIALMIGIAAGLAAVLFRYGISLLQTTLYGVEDVTKLHSFAANLPWYWVLMIPMVGGVAVGIILPLMGVCAPLRT
jgi:CIC family chloride channel protein